MKNCDLVSVDLDSITDPGQSGLYGGGSNVMPESLIDLYEDVQPKIVLRNKFGLPDPNGRIVVAIFGHSNVAQCRERIAELAPQLFPSSRTKIVCLADGGSDTADYADLGSTYWTKVFPAKCLESGINPREVQIGIWSEISLSLNGPDVPTDMVEHHDLVRSQVVQGILNMRTKMKNLRSLSLGSRSYAGYAGDQWKSREPYAHNSQSVIYEVVNEDAAEDGPLDYFKTGCVIDWSDPLWADGTFPRQYVFPYELAGLQWDCQDFSEDGGHPSQEFGADKVARAILLHLLTCNPLGTTL